MKKKSIESINLVHVICSFVIIFIMVYFLIVGAQIKTEDSIIHTNVRKTFGAGWINAITGEAIEDNIELLVKPGKTLSIAKNLPDILTNDYMIFFYDYGFRISGFVENEEIYSQGKDNRNVFGKETGAIWRKIQLNSDMAGKKFYLVLYNDTDSELKIRLNRVFCGTESYLVGIMFASSALGIVIFAVCLIAAIALAALALVLLYKKYGIYTKRLFSLAILTLIVGIWVLADGNVMQVLFANGSIRFMLSKFTLMLMPLLLNRFCEQNTESDQMAFNLVRNTYEVSIIIMLALYYFDIIGINQTIFLVHVYVFIEVLLVGHSSLKDYKNRKDLTSIGMLLSITIVGGFVIIAFFLLYITTKSNYVANITGLGYIIFLVIILFTQVRQILILYAERQQASSYEALYDAINNIEIAEDLTNNIDEIIDEGIKDKDENN